MVVRELFPAVVLDHMVGTRIQGDTEGRIVLEGASGDPLTASGTDAGMAVAWDAAYQADVLAALHLAGTHTGQGRNLGLASCLLHEEAGEYSVADYCSLPCTHHCSRCKQPLVVGEAQAFFVPSVVLPCVVQRRSRSKLAKVSGSLDASVWWGR